MDTTMLPILPVAALPPSLPPALLTGHGPLRLADGHTPECLLAPAVSRVAVACPLVPVEERIPVPATPVAVRLGVASLHDGAEDGQGNERNEDDSLE